MQKDLVSIVVPVYNVEKYLCECIDSILSQTYENIEVILVDDGSTDSSGKLCDIYKDKDYRIKVIHKENGGLSDARNAGIREVSGEYILFCDSDDTLNQEAVAKLYKAINSDENAEFVFYNASVFADSGMNCNPDGYIRKHDYNSSSNVNAAYRQLILDEYIPCAYLYFFRTVFLINNSISFEKGILGEDELFSYYVYMKSPKALYLKDALYNRRIRPGSIMTSGTNTEKKFRSYIHIVNRMYDYPERKNNIRLSNEFIDRMAKSAVYAFRILSKEQREQNSSDYQQLFSLIRDNHGFGDISLVIRLRWWKFGVLISGIRKTVRKIFLHNQ